MKKRMRILALALAAVILIVVSLWMVKSYVGDHGQSSAYMQRPMEEYTQELLTTKHRLSLNADGTFSVLILSDMHCSDPENARIVAENIRTLVDREQPSLVIFNGDNTETMRTRGKLRQCLSIVTEYIEECGIPWAHVYGNHDDEGYFILSREAQQGVYEEFSYCLSKEGEDMRGVGTFVLPVFCADSDRLAFNVWCLDSGTYQDKNGNPDFIKSEQIIWYLYASQLLERYQGAPVPAVMAFHIPLQEHAEACQLYEEAGIAYPGHRGEHVGHSLWNPGMYRNALTRGDVRIMVSAHDHSNDYAVEYGGILLCGSATIGTGGNIGYDSNVVGGRVIRFDLNAQEQLTTYMSYLDVEPAE